MNEAVSSVGHEMQTVSSSMLSELYVCALVMCVGNSLVFLGIVSQRQCGP